MSGRSRRQPAILDVPRRSLRERPKLNYQSGSEPSEGDDSDEEKDAGRRSGRGLGRRIVREDVMQDTRAQDVGARLESADDMDESPAAGKRHRVDAAVNGGGVAHANSEVSDVFGSGHLKGQNSTDDRVADEKEIENTPQSEEEGASPGPVSVPVSSVQWHTIMLNCAKKASSYNSDLLYERRHERGLYFDANTCQTHYPLNEVGRLRREHTRVGQYPARLLPGQHSDACTLCIQSGVRQAWDAQAADVEDNGSDSAEHSSAAGGDEDVEVDEPTDDKKTKCIMCAREEDKEQLVTCTNCRTSAHPGCVELSPELVKVISTYEWQCMECKVCTVCSSPGDEKHVLLCDNCDRGYHSRCVGLSSIPKGRWVCDRCGECASCGATSAAQGSRAWRFEYTKPKTPGDEPKFLQTLCIACSKQFRAGNFCPACLKVYMDSDEETPSVCCDSCEMWIHIGCDGIDEQAYEAMANSEQKYTCCICRGEVPNRLVS